uniref:Apolipoprotein L domain containing 1a n=2 Tax=Cynoglossus semilaevis TaxID=244447 RepID=A0A3P8X2M4_CYNSE
MFKKTSKTAEGATDEDKKLSASCENLLESKEKSGGISGIFKKSPKPSPRSLVSKDPLNELKNSQDSDDLSDTESTQAELSASKENLSEVTNKKESKGGFAGMFRRTPKIVEPQESVDLETPEGGGLRRRRTIKKKRRVVSFRIKKTLPKLPKSSQASEKMPVIGETVEMQEMSTNQDNTFETQPVEMAAYPTEGSSQANEEEDELMDWWNTVKGWKEWNESSNFQAEDEDMAMEQAADRVYMAARLFVRLFNQRGASLQHRILELLALADAADEFHKKTVKAAVGGGVASVAGSVATITGLILAPFTFGASIIVTAVGIGVATAGSITSATANITDTVHSNMDRKKVEKLIQDYQEEIKDIRECMEFVQEGMDTLDEWDFEKYTQSAAKKAMNHNIKHVVKEGGRAGKALMINTDKLISTVQILSVAGGAAKAAKAISVTTGVMSALFLALDVFFLARDSHELRKGAKTKFASKIRDVCKPLQDGLLELNKVKTQLQKTMDGIEVEEYEQIEEVEVEVEDELESDPKKLAELEQEIDLLEEKLDKKLEEEEQKKKEQEEMSIKLKRGEKEEKSMKEKENEDQKGDLEEEEEEEERDTNNDEKQEGKRESKMEKSKKENKPEPKGKEKDEETPRNTEEEQKVETENRSTAAVTEKDKNESVNERKENRSKKGDLMPEEWRKRSLLAEGDRSQEPERTITPEWKSVTEEEDRRSMRSHGSRSDREREQKTRESHKERGGKDRTETQRRTEEEQSVKDWKAEGKNSKRERRGSREGGESRREMERKESRRSQEAEVTRRERSTESQRSHHRREHQDKPGSTVDSMRRFETAEGKEGEEEEKERRRKRREERESQRRDYEHSRRGSRSSARMTEDGLYI